MKNAVLGLSLLMGINTFASTADQAQALWEARGENPAGVAQAAQIYGDLAAAEGDDVQKAIYLTRQSQAILFAGDDVPQNQKVSTFGEGRDAAQEAIDLLTDSGEDEALAESYYFFAANLGQWGQAKGILASLGSKDLLIESAQQVIDLGFEDMFDYGANRILGRVYDKLPAIAGGDKDKAMELLQEAFEETQADEGDISYHGVNNLYYAEVLMSDDKAEACRILTTFVAQDPETLHEERIPETKKDMEAAQKIIEDEGC